MLRNYGLLAVTVALVAGLAVAGPAYAKGKPNHQTHAAKANGHRQHSHSGQQLLGSKIHQNGTHVIDRNGKNTVSVVVKNGKVTGMKVKNADKGNLPVKKYKTNSAPAMSQSRGVRAVFASSDPTLLAQDTTYIGFSYIDDYGDEQIYWFPYDEVYDPDTGAIMYVPAY